MNKAIAILFIYLGSVCYTMASFYHLSLGSQWSFGRAYMTALIFVLIEYFFNIFGNKGANEHLSVFQIMMLVIAFDLVNLYIINALLLKNPIHPVQDGLSLLLLCGAIALSSNGLGTR